MFYVPVGKVKFKSDLSCETNGECFVHCRCYLEFEPAAGDCGRIPNALYVSLHMTQLRDRLELRLYDDMDAMERMQEIGEKQKAAAMREKRLDTNR